MTDNIDTTTAPIAVTEVLDTTAPQEVVKKKVVFDPDQQVKLEQLIRAAKSEAAKELRREHAETLRENAALRASLNLPQETQDQLAAMSDKLAQATAEYTRVDGLTKAAAKREALQAAATAANFFDVSVGGTLMAGEVTYVDDALKVIDPTTGETRLNRFGEPMTLRELATEKATKLPYMIRSTFKPGTGSVAAEGHAPVDPDAAVERLFGKTASDPAGAHRLARTNPREYQRLRKLAVEKGLAN